MLQDYADNVFVKYMPHTVMYDKHLFGFWPKQAYAEIVIPILVIY